jgi:hypothetical protein
LKQIQKYVLKVLWLIFGRGNVADGMQRFSLPVYHRLKT